MLPQIDISGSKSTIFVRHFPQTMNAQIINRNGEENGNEEPLITGPGIGKRVENV
jgi:hypothetical protein